MGLSRLKPRCLRSAATLALAAWLAGCGAPQVPQPPHPWRAVSGESPARERARLRLELATAYYLQGQDAVALEELRQALAHDPDSAAAWNLQGLVHLRQQQWRAAQEGFERALALAPGDADVLHNLGWLRCQPPQPRLAEAEPLLRQALALSQAQARTEQAAKTWAALGLCQQRAGRLDEAAQSLQQSLAMVPGQPRALWPLAQVLHAQGRWPQAWTALAQWHAQEKPSAESLWLALRLARKLDNAPLAGQLAQQLRQEFGRSPQAQALDKGWFDE